MNNLVVEASNLKKSFNKKTVFQNLNFSVSSGEIVAITGPSGCGKTTLLRCLVGLEKVDNGTINIDGLNLVSDGHFCKSKILSKIFSKVGVVFQSFELFTNLNVEKNLLIVENDSNKAEKFLNRFGLIDLKNEQISNLSGGQKQRLSIIRALMRSPKILFFDEPTSALDSVNVDEITKLIHELAAENIAQVIVTHDMNLVEKLDCRIFNLTEHLI